MSQDADQAEQAIAKSLRLRGAPLAVARVSRRALVIVGTVLIAALAGALGWSLAEKPSDAPREPRLTTAQPPETVTALPRGYVGAAGVPALGPPLPGDLGRPMLNAARARQGAGETEAIQALEPMAGHVPSVPVVDDPMVQARREARLAASRSGLFVATVARGFGEAAQAAVLAQASGQIAGQLVDKAAGDPRLTSGERLQSPTSPYVLQVGAVIPAALVTGLRSDLAGLAIAQVTQDVFDSLGGGYLLIPKGSRLAGEYDAEVKFGQSRLRVVWTRLTLPSGKSIVLDKLPGADEQGMAGLQDGVDRHGGRVLAAAALSTLLAIGAEAGSSREESDIIRALRRGGSDTASSVGRQMVGESLDLAPTLTVRPGAPLRVLLTRDLVLEPYVDERKAP